MTVHTADGVLVVDRATLAAFSGVLPQRGMVFRFDGDRWRAVSCDVDYHDLSAHVTVAAMGGPGAVA